METGLQGLSFHNLNGYEKRTKRPLLDEDTPKLRVVYQLAAGNSTTFKTG